MSKILIIDNGMFLSFAERLAEEYDQVLYYSEWKGTLYPQSYKAMIGIGVKGITRVFNLWDAIYEQPDVIFFPDSSNGDMQEYLRSLGFNVFGAGVTTKLENDREFFKDKIKEWELPEIPYAVIQGVDNLLEYLRSVKGERFIKTSTFRGDGETWRHWNFDVTYKKLMRLKLELGVYAKMIRFVIEEKIDGKEAGCDPYCILGKLPKFMQTGYELKDVAYAARMVATNSLPDSMKQVNNAVAKYIGENDVSTFFCTEERIKENVPYFNDPTMRLGCPSNECLQVNIKNLGDIIKEGSLGNMVEQDYEKEYITQIILKSPVCVKDWLYVKFPEKYRKNIRLYNYCYDGDKPYIIPMGIHGHDIVCSVVGNGNSIDEAKEMTLEIADSIEGEEIHYDHSAFDVLDKTIEEGLKEGVTIFE